MLNPSLELAWSITCRALSSIIVSDHLRTGTGLLANPQGVLIVNIWLMHVWRHCPGPRYRIPARFRCSLKKRSRTDLSDATGLPVNVFKNTNRSVEPLLDRLSCCNTLTLVGARLMRAVHQPLWLAVPAHDHGLSLCLRNRVAPLKARPTKERQPAVKVDYIFPGKRYRLGYSRVSPQHKFNQVKFLHARHSWRRRQNGCNLITRKRIGVCFIR